MTGDFPALPGFVATGGLVGLGTPLGRITCSRAGCREAATVQLDWRNPRIHPADRVKTWLACPEHADYLSDFLRLRDFPLSVHPLSAEPTGAEPTDADRGRLRE